MVSGAFYITLSVVLSVSFAICAYAIWGRLNEASNQRKSRYTHIRKLTFRFGLSIFGYITYIVWTIAIGFNGTLLMWYHLFFDLAYCSLNWITSLQILALRPRTRRFYRSVQTVKTSTWMKKTDYSLKGQTTDDNDELEDGQTSKS